MSKLSVWYNGLQEREQRIVSIGGVSVAVLLLVGGLLLPLQSAVSNAVKRADTRRADLAWMRINAPEIAASAGQIAVDTGEAPVVLVDRIGREQGLGPALRGTQPSGTGGVRVQLEAAAFDAMVQWLAVLDQQHGLAIDTITIDRAARPGIVNASITFTPSKH